MAVPQQLADLSQRCAVAQHVGSKAVAKLVCTVGWGVDAVPQDRASNHASDCTGTEAPIGCAGAQEQAAAGAVGSSLL